MVYPDDDDVPTVKDTVVRSILEAGVTATPWYIQVIAAPVRVVIEDTQRRRAARLDATVGEVAEGVGGPEVLASALADSEHEVQFVQAIEAAVRSGSEAKRRLLARAVVNAITDSARFDESQLVIDVLDELNTMHIRALALLDDELNEDGTWRVPLRKTTEEAASPYVTEDLPRAGGRSPAWDALPAPVRATLVRSGTCSTTSGLGTFAPSHAQRPSDGINDFGRELLRQLRAEARDEDARLGKGSMPVDTP